MTDVAAVEGVRVGLTRGEANRAMRGFISASGVWCMWGQTVGIGTAVFVGYALHLGADASYIALFTSMAYFLAVCQLVVPLLGRRLQRRKRYIVSVGCVEILFRSSPALIPFLFAEHLRLVLGTKVEHNSFTGGEFLPNVRLAWTDQDRYTLWGAVSRAVRLPTRGEVEGRHLENVTVLAGESDTSLVVVRLVGNQEMQAEKLVASELGFRLRPARQLSFDLAAFYHRYDDLFSGEVTQAGPAPDTDPPQFHFVGAAGNKISGRAFGAELGIDAVLRSWWRLRGGWAYLHLDMELDPDSRDAGTLEFVGDNPEHRAVLRSLVDLRQDIELDAVLFYTGRMPDGRADRHLSLDLRLGWRPVPPLSLSLVGQHLLGAGRRGLDPEFTDTFPTRTQRSLFLSLRWNSGR